MESIGGEWPRKVKIKTMKKWRRKKKNTRSTIWDERANE